MNNLPRLIDAICEAYDNVEFQPLSGRTFCNRAVSEIAEKMGFTKFHGMLANDMIQYMKKHPSEWMETEMKYVQMFANNGCLIVAGQIIYPHGHVTVVRPGEEARSGKWGGIRVPKVLNIGGDMSIDRGVNWAFQKIPNFWMWAGNA